MIFSPFSSTVLSYPINLFLETTCFFPNFSPDSQKLRITSVRITCQLHPRGFFHALYFVFIDFMHTFTRQSFYVRSCTISHAISFTTFNFKRTHFFALTVSYFKCLLSVYLKKNQDNIKNWTENLFFRNSNKPGGLWTTTSEWNVNHSAAVGHISNHFIIYTTLFRSESLMSVISAILW